MPWCTGGKAVNVARVFRLLNEPVALAAFAGGSTGQLLCEELCQSGISSYGILKPSYRMGKAITDENGKFEIHQGKAAMLYIRDVILQGYEFSRKTNKKYGFDYDKSYRSRHCPDKSNPFVFYLRKKQATGTFLLTKEFPIVLNTETEKKYWAFDLESEWEFLPRRQNNPEIFWDLEATWTVDSVKKEWRLTIKTNGEHSGIQIRDDFLYEAPTDGYVKSLDVVFPFAEYGEFPVRYFYVRLREPGMYSRFEISKHSSADEKKLYIRCEGVINPYGERSFEMLDIDFEKLDEKSSQYDREAADAFRKQVLAPRPPFEEWIKEGKARY